MSVALLSDELCIAVKCQSSSLIAGSRRNIFKYSTHEKTIGGTVFVYESIRLRGPRKSYRCMWTSELLWLLMSLQSQDAKVLRREGNSLQRWLRSQIRYLSEIKGEKYEYSCSVELVVLTAKERVTTHQQFSMIARRLTGLKVPTDISLLLSIINY